MNKIEKSNNGLLGAIKIKDGLFLGD